MRPQERGRASAPAFTGAPFVPLSRSSPSRWRPRWRRIGRSPAGRDDRLTDVSGRVIREIIA